jgi:hypothetical protein
MHRGAISRPLGQLSAPSTLIYFLHVSESGTPVVVLVYAAAERDEVRRAIAHEGAFKDHCRR